MWVDWYVSHSFRLGALKCKTRMKEFLEMIIFFIFKPP